MSAIDEFYRRYAASPIHVPPLERVLAAYGEPSPEAFAERFIEWDRAAEHPEAARLMTELLTADLQRDGAMRRFSDERLCAAITTLPAGTAGGRIREQLGEMLRGAIV